MGDWYESCALTNLPITPGDEVVVVLPHPDVEPFLHEEGAETKARRRIAHILRGHYDCYGCLSEFPDFEARGYNEWTLWFRADAWDEVQRIYHEERKLGEWYRERLELDDRTESFILKHQSDKSVVPAEMLEEMKRPRLGIEDSMAIVAIIWFANTTRLSLGWRAPAGESDDLRNHRRLVEMMQRGIDELTERWRGWRDPEDEAAGEYEEEEES